MKSICTPLKFSKLYRRTPIRLKIHDVTEKSSEIESVGRHSELDDFATSMNNAKPDHLLMKLSGKRRIDKVVRKFAEMEAVTKILQRDSEVVFNTGA